MSKIWKVAIIGCGSFSGGQYLPYLDKIRGAQLVALCDIIPERAQAYAARAGVRAWFASIDDLLAGCDFDILMNATSIPAHHEINMKALAAGKHVFTQKPAALTAAAVTEQMELAARMGVKMNAAPVHSMRHANRKAAQLIADGRLKLPKPMNFGRTIFHDSCYLGRHNDTYQAPRQLIEAATGFPPAEFERNRENSFCCGAGGGRMWMEEHTGERINRERVKEALTVAPDTLCVSCPYCMTMLVDGLKDEKAENVQVKDVAELVAEVLEQG